MAAVIKIEVQTSGGVDAVKKDVQDLGRAAEQSGGGFSAMREIATGALRAIGEAGIGLAVKGLQAVAGAISDGIEDAKLNAQIQAQTAAVLKSTGDAAGVSAEHVAEYASALSDATGKSLFGDDQIQESTNLLLTFTNIKGASLDAATAISVDMAQALGGAPKDAAIQLGKALNDPIKGITALTRVGVTFSDEQKAQIQAMQEAGDTAGAQAVILAELNKEFGGSARAAADATGGWSEFNGRMGEAKEALGAALLPLLNGLAGVLNSSVLPLIESAANTFSAWVTTITSADNPLQELINQIDVISPIIGTVVAAIADLITTGGDLGVVADDIREGFGIDITPFITMLQSLSATFTDARNPVEGLLSVLSQVSPMFAVLRGIVEAALPPIQSIITSVFGIISGFLAEHGAKIKADLMGAWQQIQGLIQAVLPPIQAIVGAIFGAIATFLHAHGADIQSFLGKTWDMIASIVKIAVALIQAIIVPVFTFIAAFLTSHGTEIQRILGNAWTAIKSLIDAALTIIKGVLTAALQIIQGDWSGAWETIKSTFGQVWEDIKAILGAAWDTIKTLFGGFAKQALDLGKSIIDGIISGVENAAANLAQTVANAAHDALKAAEHAVGMGSPAKMAIPIGYSIPWGMSEGILQGASLVSQAGAHAARGGLAGASSTVINKNSLNFAPRYSGGASERLDVAFAKSLAGM